MNIPLLTSAYFTGELLIPGIHGTTDAELSNAFDLQTFIAEYEEEYLRRLLGDTFYEEFAVGLAAGTGKWVALKNKIYTAKSYNQTIPVSYDDIAVDTEFADVVPAGYILEYVVFDNTSGQSAVLSMGTTAGACDVFKSYGIQPNGLTSVPVGKSFSLSDVTSLFLNHAQDGDDWNYANLAMYLVLSPLTVSQQVPTGTATVLLYSPAANYVYFFYQKNAFTSTGMNGESQPNQENSTVVLNTGKMVRAWNRMVEKSDVIRTWLTDNVATYTTWESVSPDYLTAINTYGT